jgi:hypothetical protein
MNQHYQKDFANFLFKISSHEYHGGVPERPKGADCKSAVTDFEGSNPSPTTISLYTSQTLNHCLIPMYHRVGKDEKLRLRFESTQWTTRLRGHPPHHHLFIYLPDLKSLSHSHVSPSREG